MKRAAVFLLASLLVAPTAFAQRIPAPVLKDPGGFAARALCGATPAGPLARSDGPLETVQVQIYGRAADGAAVHKGSTTLASGPLLASFTVRLGEGDAVLARVDEGRAPNGACLGVAAEIGLARLNDAWVVSLAIVQTALAEGRVMTRGMQDHITALEGTEGAVFEPDAPFLIVADVQRAAP